MGQEQRGLVEATPAAPRPSRRSGGIGVTLVAGLIMAAVVALALFLRSEAGVDRVQPSASGSPTQDVVTATLAEPDRHEELDALLEARSQAVLSGDLQQWMSTVDPLSTEFAAQQTEAFQNLADVPFSSWSYGLAGNGPSLSAERLRQLAADDVWVVRAVLEYELSDSGSGVVRREQYLTLTQRGGSWLIAGDQDGGTAVDLWDLGKVGIARGERSLVLGTAEQPMLERFAAEVDDAAVQVDRVWGSGWPRTVVVMVPQDQHQMAALLARKDAEGLEQIAAVTTGEVGIDSSATSADRIIINPQGFAQLGPVGREVVLSHEITHVATRATTTVAVPIWLSEGFADYVAYSGTDLGPRQIAQDVLTEVREGRVPTALPDTRDFDPVAGDIAPAYSGSWLAAHLIAERHGEDALLEFYRAVAGGDGAVPPVPMATPGAPTANQSAVDAAFASVLGTDEATFTADWIAYMSRLAG